MKHYFLTLFFCLIAFISIAQVPPPPPPAILVGCEDAEETYTCAQDKLVMLAYEALQAQDVESIIKATELDIVFMNVQIEFDKNLKINPTASFIKFHESEMKTFDVALSFSPEDLPAEVSTKFASTATVFKNYLF
jgi:deoxyribodipyrimidine photolyase